MAAAGPGSIDARNLQAGRDNTIVLGNLNIGAAPRQLSPRHQLPPPPAVFTGRDEELGELLAQLGGDGAGGAAISANPAHGLQGMGGVGKTALALVLADRLKGRYPGAQLYRDLRGADPELRQPLTPAEVMRDFIVALHPGAGQLPEELEKLGPIYHSVLSDAGPVLLLLDNAADTAQVRPLRPPAGCLLLVTSRQHLTLPGLVVRDLDCLTPDKAAALLLRLAPRVAGHAAEAAQLCGGLPLALEVFAGAINDQSLTPVPELLTALQSGEEKLEPVEAAFRVSESLLPEETRTAWHLLSIFTASFDLAAAAAVWEKEPAAARAALQCLVNCSLVEFNADSARFRLHDLARRFCEGRLSETKREEARLRHATHYLSVGEQADRLYLRGREHVVAGLLLFDRERPQLEAAFAWLQSRADAPCAALLVSLIGAVAYVGDLRFHPRQRVAWLEAQRAAARLAGNRAAEGRALGNLGNAYDAMGQAGKATELYEQELVIVRDLGDRRGEGNALGNLGIAYKNLGEVRKAIEFQEQCRVISREFGDRRGEGRALGNLGVAHYALSDMRKAIEFQEQNLVIAREIGDRRGEGAALGNLGLVYADLGDVRRAIEFYEQGLSIAQEIGDRRFQGQSLGNLGLAYADLGDLCKAIEFYKQNLIIAHEVGDRRGEGAIHGNLGTAYGKLGDARKAIEFYERTLIIDREIGDRGGEGNALGGLGDAYAALGDARKAIDFYEQHLVIAREIGDRRAEGNASFSIAVKIWPLGERARALALMETACKTWADIEYPRAKDAGALLQKWRSEVSDRA